MFKQKLPIMRRKKKQKNIKIVKTAINGKIIKINKRLNLVQQG